MWKHPQRDEYKCCQIFFFSHLLIPSLVLVSPVLIFISVLHKKAWFKSIMHVLSIHLLTSSWLQSNSRTSAVHKLKKRYVQRYDTHLTANIYYTNYHNNTHIALHKKINQMKAKAWMKAWGKGMNRKYNSNQVIKRLECHRIIILKLPCARDKHILFNLKFLRICFDAKPITSWLQHCHFKELNGRSHCVDPETDWNMWAGN